jgi:hypothetical protein
MLSWSGANSCARSRPTPSRASRAEAELWQLLSLTNRSQQLLQWLPSLAAAGQLVATLLPCPVAASSCSQVRLHHMCAPQRFEVRCPHGAQLVRPALIGSGFKKLVIPKSMRDDLARIVVQLGGEVYSGKGFDGKAGITHIISPLCQGTHSWLLAALAGDVWCMVRSYAHCSVASFLAPMCGSSRFVCVVFLAPTASGIPAALRSSRRAARRDGKWWQALRYACQGCQWMEEVEQEQVHVVRRLDRAIQPARRGPGNAAAHPGHH